MINSENIFNLQPVMYFKDIKDHKRCDEYVSPESSCLMKESTARYTWQSATMICLCSRSTTTTPELWESICNTQTHVLIVLQTRAAHCFLAECSNDRKTTFTL